MADLHSDADGLFHSEIIIEPLRYPQNVASIRTLLTIMRTCMGPHGKLKMIQNFSGSHVTVTSSSSRLFHILPVKNFLLKFIISSVRSHLNVFGNGGLCCTLMVLCILEKAARCELSPVLISGLLERFGQMFTDSLSSSPKNCVMSADLSKFSNLRVVMQSILYTKPGCMLTEKDRTDLLLILIRAFVNSFPDIGKHSLVMRRNISFYSYNGHGPSKSKLLSGILIKASDANQNLLSRVTALSSSSGKPFKTALFSVCLTGSDALTFSNTEPTDVSVSSGIVMHLKKLAIKLICDGTEIVLCQKGIHLDIREQLEDNDVLVIDRLGLDSVVNLQYVTGAVQVSSISNVRSITYGFLTSLDYLEFGSQELLLVQNEDRPFQTVLLCNTNEEALEETKVVCEQAVDTMYRLLKDSRVCCGGGCTDIYLSNLVKKKVLEESSDIATSSKCSVAEVLEVLNIFTEGIRDVALSLFNKPRLFFATETKYGHLWELEDDGNFPADDSRCKCRSYLAATVDSSEWQLFGSQKPSSLLTEQKLATHSGALSELPSIVDELAVKVNAAVTAFETVSSMLQIGLCIVSEQ